MDERLKILLGSEDVISRDNEDLYININLQKSFFEYKKEVYNNSFDLTRQFDKERNLSRNFRIYGIIDSNVIDTHNLNLKVYSDSGTTNLIYTTSATPMNFNGSMNVFNKKRGKYYIPLDNFSGTSIFIKTPSNNDNVSEQIFEQKLVFFDSDGEFIPYGTETVDIGENLETIEITNNFPFFYNKHWIKNNISLQETKYPIVNFSGNGETISEGQLLNIVVHLDKPSPFGNEKVDFIFDSGTADSFDYLVYNTTPSSPFPGNVQLQFSAGEQYKVISFNASTDDIVELLENYNFRLDNFIKLKPGNSLNYNVEIVNLTPRKYANYELTNMFENRTPYVGLSAFTYSPGTMFSTPSILRNGLYYNGFQNEFYPSDEIIVDVINASTNSTLLPSNSGLGNIDDELWLAGSEKTFIISPTYSTDIKNEVEIYLPPSLNNVVTYPGQISSIQSSVSYVVENISINGFRMQYSFGVYPFLANIPNNQSASYEAMKSLLNGGSFDIYSINEIYKPFTVVEDDANYTIKLIAKNPCIRLDVNTNFTQVSNINTIATATTIVDFSYPKQEPFRFTLLGNESSGDIANYQFKFRKQGYKDLDITRNALASESGQTNYLITSLKNVLHNWDAPNNLPILFSGNPMQQNFVGNTYFLPKSDAFYQGVLLLSKYDLTNPGAYNLTNYGASAFATQASPTDPIQIDSGRWYQNELNVIPRTTSGLSVSDVSQVSLFKIYTPFSIGSTQNTTINTNFYSFKFRNNNFGDYTTFYWNGTATPNSILNSSIIDVSGNTIPPRNSLGLKYELDLGGTFGGQVIPVGPIDIDYPGYNSYGSVAVGFHSPYFPTTSNNDNITYQPNGTFDILLTSKVPGVPFEITEIVNNNPNAEVVLMPILYNEIAGVTQNPYDNKMGGFSIIAP